MIKVGIVGSRDYKHEHKVTGYVFSLPEDAIVITGGASGVDTWAEIEAIKRGLQVKVYLPSGEKGLSFSQRAYARNIRIAEECDRLVVFWSGRDGGSNQTAGAAVLRGKPVQVFR